MAEKAIDLCNNDGVHALSLLVDKITNPDLPLNLGQVSIDRIVSVEHIIRDGLPVVSAITTEGDPVTFQFTPDDEIFAQTAVDQDGKPVCTDCSEQLLFR